MVQFKTVVIIVVIVIIIALLAVGGYFGYKWLKTEIFLPVGASCYADFQCDNGACGRVIGGDVTTGSLQCCASGKTYTSDLGLDYCTDMPNGTQCNDNQACASGRCSPGGSNTVSPGICATVVPPGGQCSTTDDCGALKCAGGTAHFPPTDICCENTTPVTLVVNRSPVTIEYCTGKKEGEGCYTDGMCVSGTYCDGAQTLLPPFAAGTCKKTVQPGGSCPLGPGQTACGEGACGLNDTRVPFSVTGKGVCCASGKTNTCANSEFCTDQPNGNSCLCDNNCASGYCDNRFLIGDFKCKERPG